MFRGTVRGVLPALVLGLAAAGCGSGGGGGKARGGADPAKQIAERTESAARSSLLQFVKDRLLVDEARMAELCGPLDDATKRLGALTASAAQMSAADPEGYKRELAKTEREVQALQAKVWPVSKPLEARCGRLGELRRRLEGRGAQKICEVVSHEVEPAGDKTPDERTSLMELKPVDFKDVLGEGPLKLKLFWKKSTQSVGYGRQKTFKDSWELRRAEPSGETAETAAE